MSAGDLPVSAGDLPGLLKEKEKEKEKNTSSVSSKGRSDYPALFKEFWSIYPPQRRTKKGEALRRWKLAAQSVDEQVLVQRARDYAVSDVDSYILGISKKGSCHLARSIIESFMSHDKLSSGNDGLLV